MSLSWNIYEISCDCDSLHGVKFRGRIRKYTIEHNIPCLVENASDKENVVRFALLETAHLEEITAFIKLQMPEAKISPSLQNIKNPVLSKLKVNDSSRYEI